MKSKILTVTIIPLLIMSVLYYFARGQSKSGYIIIEEVYNGFDFKKERESQYRLIANQRKNIVDSLELNLRLLESSLRKKKTITDEDAYKFDKDRKDYEAKKTQMDEDNESLRSQYDREILKQLNEYVKQYGDENDYEYIFGNDNDGSLMYSKDENNLSKKVITYINIKYKGIK